MNAEDINFHYPYLYHMAESGSWPSIKKYGLLSTSALLDLYEIKGKQRDVIECGWRPESVTLRHRLHGEAVIRDQKPLPDSKLKNLLLNGMTTSEYYKLLNGKTFFWVRRERLQGLLKARPYRKSSHTVLTIKTKDLVSQYEKAICLSKINSGAAIYGVGMRGRETFKRIDDYPFDEYKSKKQDAIVELTVDYSVPDVAKFTVKVEEWLGDKPTKTIWEK